MAKILDVKDLELLRLMFMGGNNTFFVDGLVSQSGLKELSVRRRLKKLASLGYIREVKVWPMYYEPNEEFRARVEAVKQPVLVKKHG